MMTAPEKVPTGIRRSRRNLIKVGALAGSAALAILASPRLASAGNGQGGNGQGGNGQGGNGHGGNGRGGNGRSNAACFLKGTSIRTADGDRKVEDLVVGDLLPTVFGGICPIQWIGRYPFKKSDPTKTWVKDVLPVRVARSALGPDVPHADLYVTKAHALLIGGVLVSASLLTNGTTITLYEARELDELEFFHIKLARHDVIYAEGAPCETLMNLDENAVNFAEYLRQHGDLIAKEIPCAPLLRFDRRRSEIQSRLRSAMSPWIDLRQELDIIRDELEERGVPALRERNPSRDGRVLA
jgi:Hint domain